MLAPCSSCGWVSAWAEADRVALVSFFPVVVTTLAGSRPSIRELLKLMRTFDMSAQRTFRQVELPTALPGVHRRQIAAVFAVLGAVFAEQAGANSGLGYVFIKRSRNC